MSDYIRLSKLCEERRLRRHALSSRNGHGRRKATEEPLRKSLRESGDRMRDAVAQLKAAIDELRDL